PSGGHRGHRAHQPGRGHHVEVHRALRRREGTHSPRVRYQGRRHRRSAGVSGITRAGVEPHCRGSTGAGSVDMTTLKVEIYKDRLLVLTGTEEQLQPLTAAPKHWLLPGGGLAVPWTWRDSAWLTAQGVPAVSPIFRDYDWPMPTDWRLMSHQARIADFCVRNRRGYVLAGTGSGKSASLTWATDYLLQVGAIKRVLVIAPLSVMSDAWTPTLGRLLLGRRRHAELYGTKELRLARARGDHDYHIINVDGLKNDEVHAQLMRNKYDAIVIDESTMIKTASTARWKLVKPLVDQATFAWQLTGTPTPQGPDDAHGQLKMFDRFGTLDMP